MFIIGVFLMGVSLVGLIGLAFMQARYPQALDSIMLPIEEKTTASRKAKSPLADAPPQPDEVAEINLDDIPVNSIHRANTAPVPASE